VMSSSMMLTCSITGYRRRIVQEMVCSEHERNDRNRHETDSQQWQNIPTRGQSRITPIVAELQLVQAHPTLSGAVISFQKLLLSVHHGSNRML
jgi:hypothetical protein